MSEISADYMKFGDVAYAQTIIPKDTTGNPEKLVPMTSFLNLFKKVENNGSTVYVNGTKSDLSVVQTTADDYYKMLVDGKVDGKTLYVISSDFVNAYGQVVKNVAEPTDDADAATKKYVDDKISAIRTKVSTLQTLTEDNATSKKVLDTVNQIIIALKSI